MPKLSLDEAYDFLKSSPLAIVGVSSTRKNFGASAFKTLIMGGRDAVPVNPKMDSFEGHKCFPNLSVMKNKPQGVVLITKPDNTIPVLEECAKLGVEKVWFQPGSDSVEALNFCRNKGIKAYSDNCILLFSGSFPHNFHLFLLKLFGKIE